MEATYQVIVLRPYFANIGKRLVKSPKVYFTDVGTLCYLTGLRDPEHAASGPMGGAILETAVLMEIVKSFTHRGMEPRLWFWRTSTGNEVDILVEMDDDRQDEKGAEQKDDQEDRSKNRQPQNKSCRDQGKNNSTCPDLSGLPLMFFEGLDEKKD